MFCTSQILSVPPGSARGMPQAQRLQQQAAPFLAGRPPLQACHTLCLRHAPAFSAALPTHPALNPGLEPCLRNEQPLPWRIGMNLLMIHTALFNMSMFLEDLGSLACIQGLHILALRNLTGLKLRTWECLSFSSRDIFFHAFFLPLFSLSVDFNPSYTTTLSEGACCLICNHRVIAQQAKRTGQ